MQYAAVVEPDGSFCYYVDLPGVTAENIMVVRDPVNDYIVTISAVRHGYSVEEEAKLVKGKNPLVKILGVGNLDRGLTVKAHKFSKTAREKIVAAGGVAEVIE